jgi:hypothetical protein
MLGVVVGSIGTIAVTWITKYYEEQTSYRELIIKTSLENFREALISARTAAGNGTRSFVWPLESFVISMSHLINKVVDKKFKIDDIDEIVSENRRLVEALGRLYRPRGRTGR